MDTHPVINHKASKIVKNIFRMLNFLIVLRYEGVFVVVYFGAGGLGEDYRNDVEAVRAVFYVICCEEIAGGPGQSWVTHIRKRSVLGCHAGFVFDCLR